MNEKEQRKLELYNQYKGMIFKVIKDMHCEIKNKEQYREYYDIAEMGLIKAINNIREQEKITTTYFYKYMKNELINYFHYKTRPKRILLGTNMANIDDYNIDSGINIEMDLIRKSEIEELLNIVERLKPEYKELIKSHYGIGRKSESFRNIARKNNVSTQSVQQKEQYIFKKIKKEYFNTSE